MAKASQKGLGKGLGALFSEAPVLEETRSERPGTLPLQKLEPNPNQPRQDFNEEALAELADSIAQHGLIEPIVVRPLDSGYYQIIAGERRWRACRMAGLSDVPVSILDAYDKKAAQLALIENLQREDLNPLEEAGGFESLIKTFGLTQDEAARSVGRSRPAVANALRLLKLPKSIQSLVSDGSLSAGHARALLPLEQEDRQREAASQVMRLQLSVRQTEALVKRMLRPSVPVTRDPLAVDYVKECETALTRRLGRKIAIRTGKKKGKIELEYYGDDDLQQLIEALESLGTSENLER
jgi:ParB family chromosome partitioning protein